MCAVCSEYYSYDIHTYECTVHVMHIMVYIYSCALYIPLIVRNSLLIVPTVLTLVKIPPCCAYLVTKVPCTFLP